MDFIKHLHGECKVVKLEKLKIKFFLKIVLLHLYYTSRVTPRFPGCFKMICIECFLMGFKIKGQAQSRL